MLKDELTANKIRIAYFMMNMGFSVWRIYYNVFLENQGLSGTQIGTINAILQASLVFVLIYWGTIADKNGIRPVLGQLILFSAILLLPLTKITNFYILLFYILLLSFVHHPLAPLLDALSTSYISNNGNNKINYGSLRAFGSLGWGVASIWAGILFTKLSISYIFVISSLLYVTVLPFFVVPKIRKNVYRINLKSLNLKIVIKNKWLLLFTFILILYGIASSPISSFLNLYFVELKANNDIIGYAYAVQALSEVPFFFIGNRIFKKLGNANTLILSMLIMFLRLLLYGISNNIYIGIILGILQGFTLSFFLIPVVDYINKLLPNGYHATAQTIIWGCYFGIGNTLGNLLTGVIKDIKGMHGVMIDASILTFFVLIITILYFYNYKKSFEKN